MEDKLCPTHPRQLRTSVLIPCSSKHIIRLPELFDAIRAQTRRPDEIVVAISGCPESKLPVVDAKIVHSTQALSAGANRNRATRVATGDVLIYQDADDLPHDQRVEIIAGLFEAYVIDHLMHCFYYLTDDTRTRFSVDQAAAESNYFAVRVVEVQCRGRSAIVTNGNVAISRAVADRVAWPEHFGIGEDQEFNEAVYAETKRTVVTALPLIIYRQNFSTFR